MRVVSVTPRWIYSVKKVFKRRKKFESEYNERSDDGREIKAAFVMHRNGCRKGWKAAKNFRKFSSRASRSESLPRDQLERWKLSTRTTRRIRYRETSVGGWRCAHKNWFIALSEYPLISNQSFSLVRDFLLFNSPINIFVNGNDDNDLF